MSISGNLSVGQTIELALPKILVNGVEVAGGVQEQDQRAEYYRTEAVVAAPASVTFTTTDVGVDLHYTMCGRHPTSKSLKYTGPIVMHQNTSGDNSIIKVRAFKTVNSNVCSKIIKAELNVEGGNTFGTK